MKPNNFNYVRAESVDHVLTCLAEHGENARILAGGQSLIRDDELSLGRTGLSD